MPDITATVLAAEDTRPRWFAVAPGLTGPTGMIWHGDPVPRPKESAPYLFGPIELSPRGRLLTLDQLMASWHRHADVPHWRRAARARPPRQDAVGSMELMMRPLPRLSAEEVARGKAVAGTQS